MTLGATLIPTVANAQRVVSPGPDAKKVLVAVFRGDREGGPELAGAIRNRIAVTSSLRALTPISRKDIETTLSPEDRADSALSPNDNKELAKLVHADEVIDGSIAKSGTYVAIDTAAVDTNYFFRQIADLQLDNSFANAAEIAAIGSAKFPRSTSLLLQKAQNERRAGELPTARASLQRALQIDPKVNGANYLLASISAEMGNPDDAIKFAQADAAADAANKPRAAAVLLQFGRAQYDAGLASHAAADFKKALPIFQAADELSPGAPSKFYLAVSAFQAIAASVEALKVSTSCDIFKEANELLTIVNINLGVGGSIDLNSARTIRERIQPYAERIDRSIKTFCK
jgi:tetratricopeptide (TPR) repeat protein